MEALLLLVALSGFICGLLVGQIVAARAFRQELEELGALLDQHAR